MGDDNIAGFVRKILQPPQHTIPVACAQNMLLFITFILTGAFVVWHGNAAMTWGYVLFHYSVNIAYYLTLGTA